MKSQFDLPFLRQRLPGVQIDYREQVGSTNDWARQLAVDTCHPNKPSQPRILLAGEQTAGRGQQDRQWWTGQGALAMSWLWFPDPELALRSTTSLAVALSMIHAFSGFSPQLEIRIKWPNDLLVSGRKLAGILIENLNSRAGGAQIIGIGCNLNNSMAEAPREVRETATSWLDLSGQSIDISQYLVALATDLQLQLVRQRELSAELLADCQALAWISHGEQVTVQLPNGRSVQGEFAGFGPDGQLQIDTPDGRQTLISGSISGIG